MDHERVNINTTSMSCGVLELSRISSDTEAVLYAIASRLYHPSRGQPAAFFAFSDVVEDAAGIPKSSSADLVDAVDRHGFGQVAESHSAENPKTGNIIVVYIWCIDHEAFKKWYSTQRVTKLAKVGS